MNFYNKDRKYRKIFRHNATGKRKTAYAIIFLFAVLLILFPLVNTPSYNDKTEDPHPVKGDINKTDADHVDLSGEKITLMDVIKGAKDSVSKTDKEPFFPDHIPAEGVITDGYGPRTDPEPSYHYAIDIAGDFASPVYAAADGEVIHAGTDNIYGFNVVINHIYDGYKTKYAHMCTYLVTIGQNVKKGDIIGFMGSTGYSTGVHLHFEVIQNDKRLDPAAFIKIKDGRTVLE